MFPPRQAQLPQALLYGPTIDPTGLVTVEWQVTVPYRI
jgi:hypothetical protein